MPKAQKKSSSKTKTAKGTSVKNTTKKKSTAKRSVAKSASAVKNKPKKNSNKAPRLVSKRKEPITITPKRNMPNKLIVSNKTKDIPNSTIALLAVLTLIFMIWSAAVFFGNINYSSSNAPTMERADNLESGAKIGLKFVSEPKTTATVGLTIGEEQTSYTYDNNS